MLRGTRSAAAFKSGEPPGRRAMPQFRRYVQWAFYLAAAILLRPRSAGELAYLILGLLLGAYCYLHLGEKFRKRLTNRNGLSVVRLRWGPDRDSKGC